ncbi:MAG: hypothetical protein Pars2KO_01350 [Parasphingorhabdus sp.]
MKTIIATLAIGVSLCFSANADYQSAQALKPEVAVAGVFRFTLLMIAKMKTDSNNILDLEQTTADSFVDSI